MPVELRLKSETVDLLSNWNDDQHRESKFIDTSFIAYLLVSFIGVDSLKAGQANPEIINLIKGIYFTLNSE